VKAKPGTKIVTIVSFLTLISTQFFFPAGAQEPSGGNEVAQATVTYEEDINARLGGLVGLTVYKTGATKLFDENLNQDRVLDNFSQYIARTSHLDVPNLTPIKIVEAKYLTGQAAALIKIEIPGGQHKYLIGNAGLRFGFKHERIEFLRELGVDVIDQIPKYLTKRETSAVRQGLVLRGMSETALYLSRGFPDKTNDWGIAGEQLIYGKSIYIYVRDGRVTDMQRLGTPAW